MKGGHKKVVHLLENWTAPSSSAPPDGVTSRFLSVSGGDVHLAAHKEYSPASTFEMGVSSLSLLWPRAYLFFLSFLFIARFTPRPHVSNTFFYGQFRRGLVTSLSLFTPVAISLMEIPFDVNREKEVSKRFDVHLLWLGIHYNVNPLRDLKGVFSQVRDLDLGERDVQLACSS